MHCLMYGETELLLINNTLHHQSLWIITKTPNTKALVALWLKCWAVNRKVAGSNPTI